MMKKLWILCSIFLLLSYSSYSQSLRSLRNKLQNEIIDKAIDNAFDEDSNNENPDQNSSNSDSNSDSDRPTQNSGGEGLDSSLDDVPQALAQASDEFKGNEYRDARSSLRRALKTLEIKIGQELLASLPEEVKGLSVKSVADNVATNSSTWAGLTIHREYQKGNTWAAISINNSSMAGLSKSIINAGLYSDYSSDEENQKSIQVKGNEAVITFSDSEGFAISISLGQQTFILIEGVNIGSEAEMIAIAESFDYDHIKKTLGDQ